MNDVKLDESHSTEFAFIFTINKKNHKFISTYSKLHKLNQILNKNEQFKNAFNNDNNKKPLFPSNPAIIGRKECGKKLVIYFKKLISNKLILTNKLFQVGIRINNYDNESFVNSTYLSVIHNNIL